LSGLRTFALALVACSGLIACSGNATARDDPGRAAKVDALVARYADYGLFAGTVLVSEHDRVLFKKGYGLANREWNIPNTPDVKFRLGSITKQFTSMLVMQQVAKGTIRLDGHLSDYLPYYRKDAGARVTIQHLLTHTSGIPSYTDNPKFFPDVSRDFYPVDAFVKQFCSGDLEFEPGTRFHYDNSGYFLLGAILEQVTGQKYDALLKAQILGPLGMNDTGYDRFADILPKRATGYDRGLGEIRNSVDLDMALPYAAGSLYSTVDDLYKWDQALYTDRLLSAELKAKMFTPFLEHYAFGWAVRKVPPTEPGAGQTIIEHEGGINGLQHARAATRGRPRPHRASEQHAWRESGRMASGIRAVLYGKPPVLPKRAAGHHAWRHRRAARRRGGNRPVSGSRADQPCRIRLRRTPAERSGLHAPSTRPHGRRNRDVQTQRRGVSEIGQRLRQPG